MKKHSYIKYMMWIGKEQMNGGKYGVYKIISGVLAIFIGYHKFILSLLDRKLDKEIWEREKNF